MQSVKRLLTPSAMSLTLSAILSLAIVVFSNLSSFIDSLLLPEYKTSLGEIFKNYKDSVFMRLDETSQIANVTNALIWAAVGAVVYMIVWGIVSLTIAVRNEVTLEVAYTSVDKHGKLAHITEIAGRGLFRACAMLLIVFLTLVSTQIWYPVSIIMSKDFTNELGNLYSWELAIMSVVGWVFVFHFYVVLVRLAMLRTRLF